LRKWVNFFQPSSKPQLLAKIEPEGASKIVSERRLTKDASAEKYTIESFWMKVRMAESHSVAIVFFRSGGFSPIQNCLSKISCQSGVHGCPPRIPTPLSIITV